MAAVSLLAWLFGGEDADEYHLAPDTADSHDQPQLWLNSAEGMSAPGKVDPED
jgi:hypothetical protein